jgi:hypothetical protein
MIQIMQSKGFPNQWITWMKMIFSSGTSAALLNGVLGKVFHCKRGVRQGDPLSPLLFILAADFLHSILNATKQQGLLSLPVQLPHDHDFPILQYADDTLIFMQGDARQVFFLKAILNSFAESTALKVNYAKSMMVPINISDDRFNILAQTFGCTKGTLPFTYLGLPLSLTRPTVADYWPLVNKCERRLSSISSFLSQAGRLQMTNVVLTALPTYTMCTYLLPKTVIKQIDKFRKHCLWRGSDLNCKKPSKAAWPLVCLPKDCGGLGARNLYTQNESLLLKHMHRFFNNLDVPWVQLVWSCHYQNGGLPLNNSRGSFWWRDVLKSLTSF